MHAQTINLFLLLKLHILENWLLLFSPQNQRIAKLLHLKIFFVNQYELCTKLIYAYQKYKSTK